MTLPVVLLRWIVYYDVTNILINTNLFIFLRDVRRFYFSVSVVKVEVRVKKQGKQRANFDWFS